MLAYCSALSRQVDLVFVTETLHDAHEVAGHLERRLLHNLLAGTVVLKDTSPPMLAKRGDLADVRTVLKFAAAVGVVLPVLMATWPPMACAGAGGSREGGTEGEEEGLMAGMDMAWDALMP